MIIKKLRQSILILLVATFTLVIYSCNKEININGEWKDVTIIFGLLDQNLDTHYIKINKAFLGSADAHEMAKVRDSSEYKNVEGVVEEWKDGLKVTEYILKEKEITNKEAGVFYAPKQTVYYFTKSRLDSLAKYKLVVKINAGTSAEKIVTAETEIVDDIFFNRVYRDWTSKGTVKGSIKFILGSELVEPNFKIVTKKDAKRYEVYGAFNYIEVTKKNGTEIQTPKNFDYKIGTYNTKTVNGGEEILVKISGEQFYQQVGKNVPVSDGSDGIVKRIVGDGSFQIRTVAVGESLDTYISVNEPTSGIVQNKKEFTNITNGTGIFSTRTSTTGSLKLSEKTILELMDATITAALPGATEGYTVSRRFCNNDIPSTQCESCNAVTSPCY